MLIDVVASLLGLISLSMGYATGAILQVFQLVLLVTTFGLTQGTYEHIAPHVQQMTGIGPEFSRPIAFALGWFVFYTLLNLLTSGLKNRWRNSRPRSGGLDRVVGGALGLSKAAIILYLVLAVMLLGRERLAKAAPQLALHLEQSRVANVVARYNFLSSETIEATQSPRVRAMAKLARLSANPEFAKRMRNDPELQTKARELMALIAERKPALARSLDEGGLAALSQSEELLDLFNDPEILALLESFPE